MLIMLKLILIISILFSISRIIKNFKRFSFKYDFFVRFKVKLTRYFKFNNKKTIESYECFNLEIKRFF